MSPWKVKTSTLILLGSVISVVLLLVVLPGVDPPDTAFHRGTAPAVVHAKATAAPAPTSLPPVVQIDGAIEPVRHLAHRHGFQCAFVSEFAPYSAPFHSLLI